MQADGHRKSLVAYALSYGAAREIGPNPLFDFSVLFALRQRFEPSRPLRIPNLGIIIPEMGRIVKEKAGLASALFSQVQLRVLGLLIGHPDRGFHASEIIRLAHSGSGAVQRELRKLTGAGILNAVSSGNRKVYQANKQSPIFEELHGLIVKTVGLVEPIQAALRKFRPKIDLVFVYGSVAKGSDTAGSDVDLMIVGNDLAYGEIFSALQKAEQTIRRPINPQLMTGTEWKRKLGGNNAFVKKIVEQPKILVMGTADDLAGPR